MVNIKMNKRGMSTIISTFLIILLMLVAVGIIWVVVKNVVLDGANEVSLDRFTSDLQIEQYLRNLRLTLKYSQKV